MIAALPMYDRPETRASWTRFWQAARDDYRLWRRTTRPDLPEIADHLTWDADPDATWTAPDLCLSQTCSLPYRTRLHGSVTLLGTIDFGLPGCPPGYYNSVLVMRADDPRHQAADWANLTLAFNAPDSQSGWAAPCAHAKALGVMFARGLQTGSHAASARAVANGRADIAALDAQTFRLLTRYGPEMAALREIGRTEPTPGLPLITRRGGDASELWAALTEAATSLSEADRKCLDLKGLTTIHPDRYTALPVPPPPEQVLAEIHSA